MPQAWTTHSEGGGEQHRVVIGAREGAEAERDVHVRGAEHTRFIERPQDTTRSMGQRDVVGIEHREDGHRSRPCSKRSLSDATSPAGGRHPQTPHGWLPTFGNRGLLMPRTNR